MRVVAIHQPTFLPWLGWWDKLARCDVFVLLDAVQFPKRDAGTWLNRVKLLIGGRAAWVTIPIERTFHGVRLVNETRMNDSVQWRRKLRGALSANYGRAAHFADAAEFVDELLAVDTRLLAELNEHAIRLAADRLSLGEGKFVRQSDLRVEGVGTDLLIELCRAVGGDAYLTGDGADSYLEPSLFPESGLGLERQHFIPAHYPQQSPHFVPGLSFVDAVANIGWEEVARLVRRTAHQDAA